MKSKEQKRDEAESRQAVYDGLTWQQKTDKLNYGKFIATKERGKNGFPNLPSLDQRWDDIELDIATMEDY